MISLPGFRPLLVALGSALLASVAEAESLKFAALKENETIVVRYVSTGCFHHFERTYTIRGSSRLGLEVCEPRAREKDSLGGDSRPEQFLVRAELTDEELAGLDSYLYYLRSPSDSWCTTVEDFTVSYYRNDAKIGEETLRDASCGLNIRWVEGKFVYDETRPPPGISTKFYKTIVTLRALEERALKNAD